MSSRLTRDRRVECARLLGVATVICLHLSACCQVGRLRCPRTPTGAPFRRRALSQPFFHSSLSLLVAARAGRGRARAGVHAGALLRIAHRGAAPRRGVKASPSPSRVWADACAPRGRAAGRAGHAGGAATGRVWPSWPHGPQRTRGPGPRPSRVVPARVRPGKLRRARGSSAAQLCSLASSLGPPPPRICLLYTSPSPRDS